jgi:hypothetical protein
MLRSGSNGPTGPLGSTAVTLLLIPVVHSIAHSIAASSPAKPEVTLSPLGEGGPQGPGERELPRTTVYGPTACSPNQATFRERALHWFSGESHDDAALAVYRIFGLETDHPLLDDSSGINRPKPPAADRW